MVGDGVGSMIREVVGEDVGLFVGIEVVGLAEGLTVCPVYVG